MKPELPSKPATAAMVWPISIMMPSVLKAALMVVKAAMVAVSFKAVSDIGRLSQFRFKRIFEAENGDPGGVNQKSGKMVGIW